MEVEIAINNCDFDRVVRGQLFAIPDYDDEDES